jgi:CBS domain-containing protein
MAHTPLLTVDPSASVADAAELMLAYDVSHVVVVDPETEAPVGVVSTIDVVGGFADRGGTEP